MEHIPHQEKTEQPIKFAETSESNPLVTAKTIAKALAVHERTVHLWAQNGTIPCKRIGTTVRFNFSEVIATLEGGKETAA